MCKLDLIHESSGEPRELGSHERETKGKLTELPGGGLRQRPGEAPRSRETSVLFWIYVPVFLVGAGLRSTDLARPVDSGDWRESDVSAIARNFSQEGMNILYPRIDWRGDGPGYAEMEFPLYSWTIAVISGFVGHQELVGRVIAYCFSIIAFLAFLLLARDLLPTWSALLAGVFFAMSPLLIKMATALHPESLMFAFYLISVLTFLRWLRKGSSADYWAALVFTALAILAKSPAALLGILFALLVMSQHGLGVIRQGSLWLFAALCFCRESSGIPMLITFGLPMAIRWASPTSGTGQVGISLRILSSRRG